MPPTALKNNLATTLRVLLFYICSYVFASESTAYIKNNLTVFVRLYFRLVPAVGLEPTRMISPQDFESSASASFTTPAQE